MYNNLKIECNGKHAHPFHSDIPSNPTVEINLIGKIILLCCKMFFSFFYFKSNTFYFTKHTSSSFVHIKSTVNIKIIRGLLQCYSIVKNTFKKFCLTIFMAINTNIMNKIIKTY